MVSVADDPNIVSKLQPTLPPIYNTWVTLDSSWLSSYYSSQPSTPAAATTTTTAATAVQRWYYQDDLGSVQGPYSSSTMLQWEKHGYFRNRYHYYIRYLVSSRYFSTSKQTYT